MPDRHRPPSSHETAVLRLVLVGGLPAVITVVVLLWRHDYTAKVQWTVGLIVVGAWVVSALMLRERVVRPLQTLSNMLAALREGDYSIRARGAERTDALGLAYLESNLLGETLRAQRLGAMEATALLRTVMAEIDVAVFAFDAEDYTLRLVNRAGERLLAQPAERLLGRTAEQLGLAGFLTAVAAPHDLQFPGAAGRYDVRRGAFRQDGRPHTLLVLADVTRALREEELQAWRRLVRVLSHEINNSLAPIRSIAGTLQTLLARSPRPADAEEDLQRGLQVIAGRSEALVRFMSAYARLARLPAPQRSPLDVGHWVRRIAALETRVAVDVEAGPPTRIAADGDQLDQLLINLIRNAADAALETGGGVRVRWAADNGNVAVEVEDDGPGLASSSNLFVPFFTTKKQGSGIGLVLSRQIAEAHGGSLRLENRGDGRGAVATVQLPVGE
jgi:nitrogen fixation/metabolism regulation signal transduction histidine kinase